MVSIFWLQISGLHKITRAMKFIVVVHNNKYERENKGLITVFCQEPMYTGNEIRCTGALTLSLLKKTITRSNIWIY